jgi:hypothetical protein
MEELQARIEELLGQLTPETMQWVDEHWIERLQQVIHTDGDYTKAKYHRSHFHCVEQWHHS